MLEELWLLLEVISIMLHNLMPQMPIFQGRQCCLSNHVIHLEFYWCQFSRIHLAIELKHQLLITTAVMWCSHLSNPPGCKERCILCDICHQGWGGAGVKTPGNLGGWREGIMKNMNFKIISPFSFGKLVL